MRVSRQGIDEIKRRNDLAEVVIEHGIELKRRGRTLFGLCGFELERISNGFTDLQPYEYHRPGMVFLCRRI